MAPTTTMDAHVTLPASFEAYRAEEVTDNVPGNQRVECLCCWRDVLLVGLHDGTIVQYAPIRPATGGEQWQVRSTLNLWPCVQQCCCTAVVLARA